VVQAVLPRGLEPGRFVDSGESVGSVHGAPLRPVGVGADCRGPEVPAHILEAEPPRGASRSVPGHFEMRTTFTPDDV
jgi:hypothetical protein